jgi:hypothetical protein
VTVVVRALAASLVLAIVPALHAQGRYRVAIGVVGQSKPLVAEFRVCVPAETSDCGSWLVSNAAFDDAPVNTYATAIKELRSPDGNDSVSIDGDAVKIRSLTPSSKPTQRAIRERGRMPRAVAITADARYVFVVFEGASGESSLIDMIELESMAVTDALTIRERPSGIMVLR